MNILPKRTQIFFTEFSKLIYYQLNVVKKPEIKFEKIKGISNIPQCSCQNDF